MSATPIGIGIVGGGMIAQIAHLPFYRADPRCRVMAVAESRPSLVAHLHQHFGLVRVVADHDELFADPAIDAVVIVAPRPATGPLVLAALAAGKHVMVEKPLAHTAAQARALVDMAAGRQRLLSVGFMKRHDPGVQSAKREVERLCVTGDYGRLLLARFHDFARDYAHPPPPHKRPAESRARRFETWPTVPDWLPAEWQDDYAWFMNAASHDINLIDYFLPHGVRVRHASAGCGALTAVLDHGGTPVVFELAKSAHGRWEQGAEFVFERGRVVVALPSPMDTTAVAQVSVSATTGTKILPTGEGWSFAHQARHFVDELQGQCLPLTDGTAALRDIELTEAIWRAALAKEDSCD